MFKMEFLNVKIENVKPVEESEDELMDIVNDEVDDCYEEGEINTDDEKEGNDRITVVKPNIFTRGQTTDLSTRSFFNKKEDENSSSPNKRFSIPNTNIEVAQVYQDQISSLYKDLGIDKENERHFRFNAIHMRGTENMSTEDVLQYFAEFSPKSVEWINDVSCNVVWVDDVSTARAFLNLSRRIKNLDKVHSNADPFEKEFRNDPPTEDSNDDGSIDARSITAAIPPGYWRLGVPCEKGQTVLLRYATRSDKKQRNSEKNSEYYKKYGNPHFGNIPGLISNSLRAQLKKQRLRSSDSIWGRKKLENDKKNPWEDLAYEWGESDKVEENHYKFILNRNFKDDLMKSDIPDLRVSLSNRKAKAKRLRAFSDTSLNSSDKETWESKSKVPRMKMYADEEETKAEKTVAFNSKKRFKKQPIVVSDLRNKINLKKKEARFRNLQLASSSEVSASDNEYDDGDSGEWALEHYNDLRESLGQNKMSKRHRQKFVKYDSESEDDMGDSFEDRDLSCRSPLQIEIENDECYLNKKC